MGTQEKSPTVSLFETLRSGPERERWAALATLSTPSPDVHRSELRKLLADALGSDYAPSERERERGPDSDRHPRAMVRRWLVGALARIADDDPEATALVRKHLDASYEPNRWVRHDALAGLVASEPADLEQLARLVWEEDQEPWPHMLAVAILASIGEQSALSELRDAMKGGGYQVSALRALRTVPLEDVTDDVIEIVRSIGTDRFEDDAVYDGVVALGCLPRTSPQLRSAADALVTVLRYCRKRRWSSELWIQTSRALGNLQVSTTASLLLPDLRSDNLGIVQEAAVALEKMLGATNTVGLVIAESSSEDDIHLEAYASGLGQLKDRRAVLSELRERAQSGPASHRHTAGQLLTALGGSESERTVFSLHGIRTEGRWQRTFTEVALGAGLRPRDSRWFYGNFSGWRFLLPWEREEKVEWFSKTYDDEISDRDVGLREGQLPSIVAHSFGTYLVGHALRRFKHLKFDRVLLCGSILPTDFDWKLLLDRGQIRRLRVEYGVRDLWVRLVGWLVARTGPSGARGFASESPEVEQVYFEYDHDDYFDKGHIETSWVNFFKGHDQTTETVAPKPGPALPWLAYLLLVMLLVGSTVGGLDLLTRLSSRQPPAPEPAAANPAPALPVDGATVEAESDGQLSEPRQGIGDQIPAASTELGDPICSANCTDLKFLRHTGKPETLSFFPDARLDHVSSLATAEFELPTEIEEGPYVVPFRWVVVQTGLLEQWEALPHEEKSRVYGVFSGHERETRFLQGSERLSEVAIRPDTTVQLELLLLDDDFHATLPQASAYASPLTVLGRLIGGGGEREQTSESHARAPEVDANGAMALEAIKAGHEARGEGEMDRAVALYESALAFSERSESTMVKAAAHRALRFAYLVAGDLDRAAEMYREAVVLDAERLDRQEELALP